jgi:hypothetical protein
MSTNQQQGIFRLAASVTLASTAVMTIDWPLAFIAPLLVVSIVSGNDQAPSLKSSAMMVVIIVLGMLVGLLFSALFLNYPPLASILLFIIFFWIYYLCNLGKLPAFAGLILLLGMTIIPMMTVIHAQAAHLVAAGLVTAAIAALIFANIAYWLFPAVTAKDAAQAQQHSPDTTEAMHKAITSTLVVLPAILSFITFEWSGGTLIIVFIAILSLNPALEDTRKAGTGLLMGNAIGGGIAMIFFLWMNISPHLSVYIVTIAFFSLYISRQLYSGKKLAPLWGMALSTMLLLTGSIMSGSGGEADTKLLTRLFQIVIVATYMVLAVHVLVYISGKLRNYFSYDRLRKQLNTN